MTALVKAEQIREAIWGTTLTSPAAAVPTVSANLWNVSGGPVRITGVVAIVTTVFTATVSALSIGTAAGAATLISAAALASLAVGAVIVGIPTPAAPVVAANGGISWIATVANTGQLTVYLSYIPVIPAAIAQ